MGQRSLYLFILCSSLFFSEILCETNKYIINEGESVQEKLEITEDFQEKNCSVRYYSNEIYPNQTNQNPNVNFDDIEEGCQVNIINVTKYIAGEWTLIAKINRTEDDKIETLKQSFIILLRDEQNKPTKRLFTKRNGTVEYEYDPFYNDLHYCFLVRPNGIVYELHPKSNITDDQILLNPKKKCYFKLQNVTDDYLGPWKLLAEVKIYLENVYAHINQPISIEVEEILNKTEHIVKQGRNMQEKIEISNDFDDKNCSLERDRNTIYPNQTDKYPKIIFNETNNTCLVNINNMTKTESGEYSLIVKLFNKDKIETVKQPFYITYIEEQYKNVTRLITKRNGSVQYEFKPGSFDDIYQCLLVRPNGTIYEFYPKSNVTDEQIITNTNNKCYFKIENVDENYLGEWKMFIEYQRFFEEMFVHVHQPLNVQIEEKVEPAPSKILEVYEGENIYISLAENIDNVKNCTAQSPTGEVFPYVNSNCLHFEQNVSQAANGTWKINGTSDIYLLYTTLDVVIKPRPVEILDVTLYYGSRATLVFGSEDSLYCKAVNQNSKIELENIGQCIFQIDSVTAAHNGTWIVNYGVPESMTTLVLLYNVHVVNIGVLGSGKLTMHYDIDEKESNLNVSCKIFNTTINSARLIRSDGKPFLIHHGIGFDKYKYFINHDSNKSIMEYGIQINNPNITDKATWKCIFVYNDSKNESGSWIVPQSPIKNDQLSSPTDVNAVKNESFTILCEYPRPISYCWFSSPNGTIFSLLPSISTNNVNYEYFGSGLSLGDCGIKIKLTQDSDHGKWKCNIGTSDYLFDKAANINVQVQNSPLKSNKFVYTWHDNLVVTCGALKNEPLEYCRYVKPDGNGISPSSQSTPYNSTGTNLDNGECVLNINKYYQEDMGLWKCIAKPQTANVEYIEQFHIYTNIYLHTPSSSTLGEWILFMCLVLFIVIMISLMVYRFHFAKIIRNRRANNISQSEFSANDFHFAAAACEEKVKV